MRINYMSDLHLEFGGPDLEVGEGDVLILAGDVCTASSFVMRGEEKEKLMYLRFFNKCVENYKKVFYVMGNHEHYSYFYDETEKVLREHLPEGITLLHNQSEYYDGVHFVGATLWTNFNNGDGATMQLAQNSMNDYHTVYKKSGMNLLTPQETLKENDNTVKWFNQCIPTLAQGPVVVITHHAPSPQSFNNGYREESSKPFYVNDLESFINKNKNIKYWVHGHIHETNNYQIGECNVVSNPRGYYKYGTNEEFLMNKTILINS